MKKILVTILSLLILSIGYKVDAASFSTYLSGNKTIYENGTVTITVGVNNASDLWGFKAPISYDSSKLTLTSYNGQNGFGIAVGSSLVVDNSTGKNGSFKVATLTFKATSNFKIGESTTISLGSAEGSDGNSIMSGNGSSITISVVAPKSSNNNLKSLSLDKGNINFQKNNLNYSITVDYNVSDITINASAEDSKASVSGTGKKSLALYNNNFQVVVKAENGSTKTYNIEVIRKDEKGNIRELSNDNSLKSMTITGYSFVFDPSVVEYTVLLKDSNILEIVAEPTNQGATVTVNNLESYNKGNNIIEVSVVSESGIEKIYKINAIQLESEEEVPNETPKEEEESNNSIIYIVIIVIEFLIIVAGFVLFMISKKKENKIVEQ